MHSKLAAILSLIAFPGICSSQALAPKEIFNSASKSIVVIVTGDENDKPLMQGSGVVFGDGLVLTNCHVLEDSYAIEVETQGKSYSAVRLRNDKDRDLCSLTVAGLPAPKVRVGSVSNLSVGDKVFAIGAPRGLDLTFTDGLVSSIRDGQVLQTTAAISPGSSGGGLFDEYGRLVGITTLTLKDSQGLNFAVPVEWATALASNLAGISAIQDRSDDEIEVVMAQLNKYEEELRASDPGYEQLKPKLYAITSEIVKKYPRSQWLAMVKLAYASIREEWESAARTSAAAAAQAADAATSADDSFNLTTIDGKDWDLASHRGHWVVVNFWATWCEPCQKVMTELSTLDVMRDHVEVIGLDYEDIQLDALKAFMQKHPVAYPIAIVDVYDPPRFFEAPRGLPNTYLITPDGTIAKHFLGPVTAKDIREAITKVGNPRTAG